MSKKLRSPSARHLRLYHWMMATKAWQSLSIVARALYIELSSRYHGTNNGEIVYSVRQAAKALKISKDTAARGFEELQKRGFVCVHRKGGFNLKVDKRQATEWRLTEFPCGSGIVGTKDFARWSEGNDFPINKGPKPDNKRNAAKEGSSLHPKPAPMANYTCPTKGTTGGKNTAEKSHHRDHNVVSAQHRSQHRDWLVLTRGPYVSPQGPRFEFKQSEVAS